jgi:hypothetical protein
MVPAMVLRDWETEKVYRDGGWFWNRWHSDPQREEIHISVRIQHSHEKFKNSPGVIQE